MVSVIVDACNSHKFLVRSLNSIRRQTYKDIEIIVVAKDDVEKLLHNDVKLIVSQSFGDGLKKAVVTAIGEKIYFCNSTSVLTDNVIEDMVKAASDSSLCVYTKVYIKNNSGYVSYLGVNALLYGKLVDKKVFEKALPNDCEGHVETFISYLKQCSNVVTSDGAILYVSCTETELFQNVVGNVKEESFKKLLKEVSNSGMDISTRNYITAGLGEFIALKVDEAESIMFYISNMMPQDVWLNYAVSRKTISRWWNIIQNGNSTRIYTKFIEYISAFDDELMQMMLKNCGINKSIFEIMKVNEQDVFLNIYNSIKKETGVAVVKTVATAQNNAQEYTYELSGMQLADYVVDKYRSGSLGLKTFFKSFGAWIKFKLKR